jgi:hypothetical protein
MRMMRGNRGQWDAYRLVSHTKEEDGLDAKVAKRTC